jgi:undecaprenyldiphospho-muramoylpentapeptide beta-N-acetylglucosaminyltransferase
VSPTYALVTGGGTGGHVYPAIAVADELVARGHSRDEIRFVGAQRGLETTVVPAAGYAIDVLPGRGLDRGRTVHAVVRNLRTAFDTTVAFGRAWNIVRRTRPRVVVGVGGYASLPTVVAGRLQRVPAVVHEADAHPGLANRLAVRFGARAAVSLPGTPLPGAVVTGNPIRPEIVVVRRAPVTPPVVAVVGGSLGARRINDAAVGLAAHWRDRTDVVIHHVTGTRGYEECRRQLDARRRGDDRLDYRLFPYEDHMETVYTDATLIVCRAGGMTAELAAVGIPSVLVPLPGAPGDHQARNAEVFVGAGAAVMVPDAELDTDRLATELESLLADPARLAAMGDAARTLGRVDAAARVADLVEEVAGGR